MPIVINERWCKKCLICLQMCPKNLLEANDKGFPHLKNLHECSECENCAWICPDFAIDITEKDEV